VHPIERLRYVARAEGAGPTLLGVESAVALAGFSADPAGLVTACRRLLDRHSEAGTVWWVSARALLAPDPATELHAAASELEEDKTSAILAAEIPEAASVVVVGWPEQVGAALERRADVVVLAVSSGGDGEHLARRLGRGGGDAIAVPDLGAGAAAADADLVLLEAVSVGPDGILASAGSRATAAVARDVGTPVWVVAGAGRVLPEPLWEAALNRLDQRGDPWDLPFELVPLSLADVAWGPHGRIEPRELPARGDCPCPPELLRGGTT
jgi:hypothetical protein